MIAFFLLKRKSNQLFIGLYLLLVVSLAAFQIFFSPTVLFESINQFVNEKLNLFFEIFTWIGSGWTYGAVCLLVLIFNRKYFWLFVSSFAATSLVAQIIKYFLPNIARPVEFFAQQKIAINFPVGAEELHWNSFPSGHTTSAFSLFLLLSLFSKNKIIVLLCFASAALVALSRVYLTAHFVRDVYWGMIFGTEITSLMCWLFENKIRD